MKKVCASCTTFSTDSPVISSSKLKPQWLKEKDFVKEFIEKQTKFEEKQPSYDQIIEIDLGKNNKNRTVLYWAAMPSKTLTINEAKKAYGSFKNSGIVELNNVGKGNVYLLCPQIYKTKQHNSPADKTFFRHFHFIFADKEKSRWLYPLYTRILICKRNIKFVADCLSKGTAVIINALPHQYYAIDHIPNSYNLHHEDVATMSKNKFINWIKSVIFHYPKIESAVFDKKITIEEIPIICYCANSKCNASSMLEKELLKKGMLQVDSFAGGMQEWNENFKTL